MSGSVFQQKLFSEIFSNPRLGLVCWSWENCFCPQLAIQRCLVHLWSICTRLPERPSSKFKPEGCMEQTERMGLSAVNFRSSLFFCPTLSQPSPFIQEMTQKLLLLGRHQDQLGDLRAWKSCFQINYPLMPDRVWLAHWSILGTHYKKRGRKREKLSCKPRKRDAGTTQEKFW